MVKGKSKKLEISWNVSTVHSEETFEYSESNAEINQNKDFIYKNIRISPQGLKWQRQKSFKFRKFIKEGKKNFLLHPLVFYIIKDIHIQTLM